MFRNPLFWIVLLLSGMLAFVFWPQEAQQGGRGFGGAPLVEVKAVERQTFNDEVAALGNAQANESIELKAEQTVRVTDVHFDDGEKVEQGTLLVTLRHDQEKALIAELDATLKEQRRQLTRLRNLEKQSATAASAIEQQQSLLDATEAKRKVAIANYQEKFIKAPFSGLLGLREISPGQLVTTNTTITTLDDISKIKVEFQLPEKYLNKVKVGQRVNAKHIAFNTPFIGQVDSIGSRIDQTSRAFTVRALFDNAQGALRPGMLLQLALVFESNKALVIPESAIVPINNDHFVYVLNADDTVSRVKVEIGKRKPGIAEVLSGLEAGTKVVHKGVLKIRDGAQVKVAGDNKKANPTTKKPAANIQKNNKDNGEG
ncbi:efflux RND transporter periplasmic adaptor subunit [Psychrosphaera ytuae]|uniref:Efflux RND transporter periplasmic adaptor subunit n=1 Tax=Psychrosphaera ytuae TaxID=2820710 RepID=A0A975DEF7_9GAMM|nr:efflux RND transporter periplasmic adaptor subunit [Psychrosphaera ytuae]QTH64871.1 efflux RND transporter periplasmic adaptor subunit [Psychrosphaera ytuae]